MLKSDTENALTRAAAEPSDTVCDITSYILTSDTDGASIYTSAEQSYTMSDITYSISVSDTLTWVCVQ